MQRSFIKQQTREAVNALSTTMWQNHTDPVLRETLRIALDTIDMLDTFIDTNVPPSAESEAALEAREQERVDATREARRLRRSRGAK